MEVRYVYKALPYKITDGDTLWMEVDLGFRASVKENFRVRLIDTPEIKKYAGVSEEEVLHGLEAKAFAEKLLYMAGFSPVTIKSYKNDPGAYARWECDIVLHDGRDFATVMKENGMYKGTYVDGKYQYPPEYKGSFNTSTGLPTI